MKTYTTNELNEIIDLHKKWLLRQDGGKCADLRGADLSGADLRGAYLRGAYLSRADLSRADLSGAYLRGAYLRGAYLRGAYLSCADLRGAYLRGADLSGADLSGADLSGANLRGANGADLAIARTRILPEGDLIGYKKCRDNVIVKLLIPATAKRSHAFGRKCRAEFAKVIEISSGTEAISEYNNKFIYRVGEIVRPLEPFSENWQEECESGIHFYITRIEAENHF